MQSIHHLFLIVLAAALVLTACGRTTEPSGGPEVTALATAVSTVPPSAASTPPSDAFVPEELAVSFGDEGSAFAFQFESNETASAIAALAGSREWQLPVYEEEGQDALQYYDMPSRYEIPASPQLVTSAAAGEVFYSDPNRIILYVRDVDGIEEQYVRIGQFDGTDAFMRAATNNPVLEGWGNRVVRVAPATEDLSAPAATPLSESIAPQEDIMNTITVTIGEASFAGSLEDNDTARTFSDLLPVSWDMTELNGNEKYFYLDTPLPADPSRPAVIHSGDIMLYGDDCIVLFYADHETTYTYTLIGHVNDPAGLAEALGSGSAQVAFSAQ